MYEESAHLSEGHDHEELDMRKRHEAYEPCIKEGGLRRKDKDEANCENNVGEVRWEAVERQADDEQTNCK